MKGITNTVAVQAGESFFFMVSQFLIPYIVVLLCIGTAGQTRKASTLHAGSESVNGGMLAGGLLYYAAVMKSIPDLLRALTDASVQFVLVGGFAVQLHGFVRTTIDLDLVRKYLFRRFTRRPLSRNWSSVT